MLSGARLDPVYLRPWSRTEREDALDRAMLVPRRSADRLEPSGVTVEPQARFGHPIQEILRAANRQQADLILLGAKGHSALKLMLLGSVAQGVLEYARCPVLLVRPGSTAVGTAVVGIDGSKESLKALQHLQGLALKADALLVLTRVVQLVYQERSLWHPDNRSLSEVGRINDDAKKRAEQDLAAAHDVLSLSGRSAVNEILVGRAGKQLLKAAAQREADLIVVGSRAPSRVRKYLIGSTAEMIAREALTSVLVVR
jgi:nucleotide-binding universal stress UspA family protein